MGRELSFDPSTNLPAETAPVMLEVEDVVVPPVVRHASMEVRARGNRLPGRIGGCRTHGALRSDFWYSRSKRRTNPGQRREDRSAAPAGCHASQHWHGARDRRDAGLFLAMSISANIAAANLKAVTHGGVIARQEVIDLANQYTDSLRIATPSIDREVMFLSGGNHKKRCWRAGWRIKPKF